MSEVYNTTDVPVVLDDEGHTLGGRERADVRQTDQVKAAIAAGQLVKVEGTKSSSRTSPKTTKAADKNDPEE